MIQESYLQVFDLTLVAKSPVFIGSGRQYTKKEYLFDPEEKTVSVLDEEKVFRYLAENGLADDYEDFVLHQPKANLQDFLTDTCGISQSVVDGWVRYKVYAGDALSAGKTLKEIRRIVRNGNQEVYIPGSSIKGALRTVLLKAMLLESSARPDVPGKKDVASAYEVEAFHTLGLKSSYTKYLPKNNPANSILRGVRISDSLPIPDSALCLTGKKDVFSDNSCNILNICRESIRPGTRIHCTITLDQSILQGKITKERILEAIAKTSRFYQESVLAEYPQAVNLMDDYTILLGGGVGFQSKSILSPYYDGQKAMEETMTLLQRRFRKHNHEMDNLYGISPRALKQTVVDGEAYPYGVCEVIIQ